MDYSQDHSSTKSKVSVTPTTLQRN